MNYHDQDGGGSTRHALQRGQALLLLTSLAEHQSDRTTVNGQWKHSVQAQKTLKQHCGKLQFMWLLHLVLCSVVQTLMTRPNILFGSDCRASSGNDIISLFLVRDPFCHSLLLGLQFLFRGCGTNSFTNVAWDDISVTLDQLRDASGGMPLYKHTWRDVIIIRLTHSTVADTSGRTTEQGLVYTNLW